MRENVLMLQIKETGGWNLICGSFKAQGDSRLVVTVYINGEKVKSSLDDTDIGRSVWRDNRKRSFKYWNHISSKAKSGLKQKSKLHWNPSIGDFFVKAKSSTNDGVSTSEGFLCSEKSFSLA